MDDSTDGFEGSRPDELGENVSGELVEHQVPCPVCLGVGDEQGPYGLMACEPCGGSGLVSADRRDGPQAL